MFKCSLSDQIENRDRGKCLMMSDWQYGELNCFVGGKKTPKNSQVIVVEESIVITDIQIQKQALSGFKSSFQYKA